MVDLSELERVLLRLRFHEDLTQSQITQILGLSQMRVSRMIRGAIEKLHTASELATTDEPT